MASKKVFFWYTVWNGDIFHNIFCFLQGCLSFESHSNLGYQLYYVFFIPNSASESQKKIEYAICVFEYTICIFEIQFACH